MVSEVRLLLVSLIALSEPQCWLFTDEVNMA